MSIIKQIKNSEKKIGIYGAGKIAKSFYVMLHRTFGLEADFFCDKDPSKWGVNIVGDVKCISLKELAGEDCICLMLIGQRDKESALEELTKYTNIEKIITFDDLINLDEVVENILGLKRLDIVSEPVKNKYNKKLVVYTCITGGYEELIQPKVIDERIDYYCITDYQPENLGVYKWIDANNIIPENITDNTRRNRFCKIMGVKIFSEYEYSLYIDGNIHIVGEDLFKYISRMNKYGFMSHSHAFEDCIYSEAVRVLAKGKDNEETIKAQMGRYYSEGMPRHYGMLHNAVLVRENNNPICQKLMNNWFNEVCRNSKRDQLSLTYCLWKLGISPGEVGTLGDNMRGNPDFEWVSRHDNNASR